jgi:S-DNA-T family DNA segregation ATPase FtsK/SpoIIIE
MNATRGSARHTRRATGGEWRALAWLCRHPGFLLVPAAITAAVVWLGPWPVLWTVVGTTVDLIVWARVHPPSFDRWAAPWLRRYWRRWTVYRGRRWAAVLIDCDLVRDNRRTGQLMVPRVLRVRSRTRSIDTLYVRMARGQDLHVWTEKADALAVALFAHRVAIAKVRPAVLAVVVEREMPFGHVVPAPDIPGDPREVDLSALDVGDDEHGNPFRLGLLAKHVFIAGASGAGKGSLLWSPLRAIGPMIPAGLVKVSMIDLKGGAETARGRALFARYATTMADALDLLTEVRDAMKARQEHLRVSRTRKLPVCEEWPLELVMVDEMAMLTAYGDRADVREALRLLAEILTQGRACLVSVIGYVQEPSKDIVDVRELFTTRICLGVTAASHVDMVLGDGARERGALADEIPGDEAHAGIGFVIDQGSRLPVRFRAAYVADDEIDELVTRCAAWVRPGDVIDLAQHRGEHDDRDNGRDDEDGDEGTGVPVGVRA